MTATAIKVPVTDLHTITSTLRIVLEDLLENDGSVSAFDLRTDGADLATVVDVFDEFADKDYDQLTTDLAPNQFVEDFTAIAWEATNMDYTVLLDLCREYQN